MSGNVHSIRLRGPWILKLLPRESNEPSDPPPPIRFHWPPRWSEVAPGCQQPATLHRFFQKPPELREERVFVVVETQCGGGQLRLNSQPLGALQPPLCRFDVTSLLRPRNELLLAVETGRDELVEVRLEIA